MHRRAEQGGHGKDDGPARTAAELQYVLDLGLNAVRLEGKFQDDDLFAQATAAGLMMIPGICCCDACCCTGVVAATTGRCLAHGLAELAEDLAEARWS